MSKDAVALQRKIFSRFCAMKLKKVGMNVTDVVEDAKDGMLLLKLVEVLSDEPYEGKPIKASKMRVQVITNVNTILKFIFDKGVEMKLKPSAENILDGDERSVLGLVFAIMLKFMKIGDDEGEALNAKDALLMWVKNKVASYGLKVESYKKDFADGKVLCALIHKHRAKLIDMDKASIDMAQEAAYQYFELEKYVTADEIRRMDENCAFVYVSEFYYGIAESRKVDLAIKRINKVIAYTEQNDALRAKYAADADAFVAHIKKVMVVLEDRTIDNTMAGAKNRIAQFDEYKEKDKGEVIKLQMNLEGVYNNLSTRLAQHKRPTFKPNAGQTLDDIQAAMKKLEECEQERNIALHAELNRQIRLAKNFEQHQALHKKNSAWWAEKETYLKHKEESNSVGEAQAALDMLDACEKEVAKVFSATGAKQTDLGKYLVSEKFEHSARVQECDGEVPVKQAELGEMIKAKRPVLQADLAREQKKEELRLEFAYLAGEYQRWVKDSCESLGMAFFGMELAEVEAYQQTLTESDAAIRGEGGAQLTKVRAVDEEARGLGVKENPYTPLAMEDLAEEEAQLEAALKTRADAYAAELARQRANDALCKEFAAAIDPFMAELASSKQKVTQSGEPLDAQLAHVSGLVGALSGTGAPLATIDDLAAKIEAAGVTNNRHTAVTAKDAHVTFAQYTDFLKSKQAMLEEEIAEAKMRGMTQEELDEIAAIFAQFAGDAAALAKSKLRAALYSLGEERSGKEIDDTMDKFGKNDQMDKDAFVDFMIGVLGVSDDKADIIEGFKLITKFSDIATEERMKRVMMDDHDVDYIKNSAPSKNDGYDYVKWADDIFSR